MATDFTIADVLAWARTKPADGAYEFQSCDRCALGQFLLETGRAANPDVWPDHWYADGYSARSERHDIDPALAEALAGPERGRSTWAELVTRLSDIEQVSA